MLRHVKVLRVTIGVYTIASFGLRYEVSVFDFS